MGIRVLAPGVAAQIAAGEVVERPASVVKELVENSIDAGARDIQIELEQGGRKLIRIIDDGSGIPAAEVELAFQRHSTSKLADVGDLDHITTLGFRGEALASIAAVSRVTFVTRSAEEEMGTLLRLEGERVVAHQPTGRPPGTTMTVEDLFFNVPARRKFLRSVNTERRHIDAWVTRYAMAYPDLRFTLTHDGRETFRSPGSGNLREVLVAVHKVKVGSALLAVLEDPGGDRTIQVQGFVSPPSLHRGNRTGITLFINGRWIQDTRLTYAVIQAYHTLLPTGRYPIAVLKVSMPPQDVDVNVHPTKAEVRFRDADVVFRAVQRAVRQTVVGHAPVPTAFSSGSEWVASRSMGGGAVSPAWSAQPREGTAVQPALIPQETSSKVPLMRVVGQVGAAYVVAEGPEGLFLIDQHAAHERVLYEQLMAQQRQVPSQRLLEPVTVELSPEAAGLVESHVDLLRRLGFDLEHFGGGTFLLRALPVVLLHPSPAEVLSEIAGALEEGRSLVDEEIERAVIRRVCKQAAVKAGQVLTREEMEQLVGALETCDSPRTCPHGRPTMIHISISQLAREFGRT